MTHLVLNLEQTPIRRTGHKNYVLLDSADISLSAGASYYHGAVLDTQGIVASYTWKGLAPAQGVYTFTNPVKTLNYAQSYGKSVILRFFYKNYAGVPELRLPDYITSDHITYGGSVGHGGLRPNAIGGYTPRFDHPQLMAHFKDMITALAAEIADHPALQGVGFDESAWSFANTWGTGETVGLTAAQVRAAHREMSLHLQSCFPGKEIYPFYNYCDGSTATQVLDELRWSWTQGMLASITDTHRYTDMSHAFQPVMPAYPINGVKTIMCVDHMSTGNNDSGVTERMLENARTTALRGADITAWYIRGGASSAWWTAVKNAIAIIG